MSPLRDITGMMQPGMGLLFAFAEGHEEGSRVRDAEVRCVGGGCTPAG